MIHIKRAKNGQFYFIVKAKNGKTLVTSEQYKRKAGVMKAIASLNFILAFPQNIVFNTNSPVKLRRKP